MSYENSQFFRQNDKTKFKGQMRRKWGKFFIFFFSISNPSGLNIWDPKYLSYM